MLDGTRGARYTSLDSLLPAGYLNWRQILASKAKKSPTKGTSAATVTRIVARDDTGKRKEPAKKPNTPVKGSAPKKERADRPRRRAMTPLKATGGYFKGAWQELRQVRWPTRKATWSLTLAMLAFTAFFVVVVLLLDALFKYLFQLILG